MAGDATLVLTYHSIGYGSGPTSIPPPVFAAQMRILADANYKSLTLGEFSAWRRGEVPAHDRQVLITFDDGFLDFHSEARPVLKAHGFASVVFVPTGKLGGVEDWDMGERRPLMSWSQVAELAADGVEFGAHGIAHRNLLRLSPDERRAEIAGSGRALSEALGRPVRAFAAPYGSVDAAVLGQVADSYEMAFGTRLGLARRSDPAFDIPRVEMHYFREAAAWRGFVEGGRTYFNTRRALRSVREAVGRAFGPAR